MSASEYRCKRELPTGQRCQAPLGLLIGGRFQPLVPVEWVDYYGTVHLRCRTCGAAQEYRPKGRDAPEDRHATMLVI